MSFVCQSWHKENVRPAKFKVLNAFLFGLEYTVNRVTGVRLTIGTKLCILSKTLYPLLGLNIFISTS